MTRLQLVAAHVAAALGWCAVAAVVVLIALIAAAARPDPTTPVVPTPTTAIGR